MTFALTGESDTIGNVLTASVQLEDKYGNATVNTTAITLMVDIQATGQGNVVPGGTGALSILSGQSTPTSTFSLTRSQDAGQSVVVTATMKNTSPAQTVTITLSS